MSRINLIKRVLAGVSVAALMVTTLPKIEFTSFDVHAEYAVDGEDDSSFNDGDVGSVGADAFSYHGKGQCGIRIYFARRSTYTSGTLKPQYLYNRGRSYALYEFFSESGGGYAYAINGDEGASNGSNFYYISNDSGKDFRVAKKHHNLSYNKGLNIDTAGEGIKSLFGSNNARIKNYKLNPWMTSTDSSVTTHLEGESGLIDWANNIFGEKLTAEEFNTFLSNYSSKFSKSYKDLGLPTNVDEYNAGNWCLVIEPVSVIKKGTNVPPIVVSYQDYNGFNMKSNKFIEAYYSDPSIGSGIIHDLCNAGGGFWAKFKSGDYNIDGSTADSTKGFGVFSVNDNIIINTVKARANHNFTIYGDTISNKNNNRMVVSNKGGIGFNKGAGQLSIVKKTGDDISQVSSYGLSNLSKTAWYSSTGLGAVPFLRTGSKTSIFNTTLIKEKGTKTGNDETSAFCKLVGTSTNKTPTTLENVITTDKYILQQYALFNLETEGSHPIKELLGTLDPSKVYMKTKASVASETGFSIGNVYSVSLSYKKGNSYADGLTEVLKNSDNDLGSDSYTKLHGENNYRISGTSVIDTRKFLGNLNASALSKSELKIKKTSTGDEVLPINGTSSGNKLSEGITAEVYLKDKQVTSRIQKITRAADGSISYGFPTLPNGYENTYSIFGNGSPYNISGTSNSDENGLSTSYVVCIPNDTVRNGHNFNLVGDTSNNHLKNFQEYIFDDCGLVLNVLGAESALKTSLTSLGYSSNEIIIKPLSDLSSNNTDNIKIRVGACPVGTTDFAGYSIYVIEDAYVTQPQDTEMSLKAYEANYVYPTLLGDTDGHIIKTVGNTSITSGKSFGNINITKVAGEYSGTAINRESVYTNLFDLMYSTAKINGKNQYFAPEASNPKNFANPGSNGIWLNHQVNLTRGTFGEDIVASSFSTKNRSNFTKDYITSEDFITKVLGYSLGTSGSASPAGLEAGKTSQLSTGSDVFRWACDRLITVTYSYVLDGKTYTSSYFVNPYVSGEDVRSAGYNVSEKSYRYVTNDRGTGKGTSAKLEVDTSHDYHGLFSKSYDDVLSFYPEVDMVAYTYDATSNKLSTSNGNANNIAVAQTRLAALGEKKRTVNPTGVFAVRVVSNTNPLVGVTKSDTVATGSDAKALSKKFGNLQVIYAGGNVNLSAESSYAINVSGFVLDQIDSNVDGKNGNKIVSAMGSDTAYNAIIADNSDLKSIWGNSNYKPEEKYAAWVESFKGSLAVDVSLDTCKKANGDGVVKTYTGFKVSQSKVTGGNVLGTTSYALTYKNGAVVNDDAYKALIRCIADEYFGDTSNSSLDKAKQLFADSGINKSILDSIESNTDADNGSEKAEAFGNKKWYDEQVRTFVVRYYKCEPVKIGKVLVSDKIDINAGPSQDKNTHTLFQNGYVGRWNMTVYLSKAVDQMPDMEYYVPKKGNLAAAQSAGSVLIANKHIEGADFIISDATTADARN